MIEKLFIQVLNMSLTACRFLLEKGIQKAALKMFCIIRGRLFGESWLPGFCAL